MSLPDEVWALIGEGSPLYEMVEEWSELRAGWDELKGVAPDLTGYLEGAEELYKIKYGEFNKERQRGGYSDKYNTITVDRNLRGNAGQNFRERVKIIACVIAHEAVHTFAEGSRSIYEEIVAYKFMYLASERIGAGINWQSGVVSGVDVFVTYNKFSDSLTTALYEAKETWEAQRRYENVDYLYPSEDAYKDLWENIVLAYHLR